VSPEVFLDSSFIIALTVPGDEYHDRAVALSDRIAGSTVRLVTTRAVMFEIGNALARRRYRRAAVDLLSAFEIDRTVEIVSPTPELFATAFEFYRHHADKEWGLTDCLSFVVMRQRGIREALTADHHFRQGGFVPLLTD
jgi:predicted nucleic acid-binding protein